MPAAAKALTEDFLLAKEREPTSFFQPPKPSAKSGFRVITNRVRHHHPLVATPQNCRRESRKQRNEIFLPSPILFRPHSSNLWRGGNQKEVMGEGPRGARRREPRQATGGLQGQRLLNDREWKRRSQATREDASKQRL